MSGEGEFGCFALVVGVVAGVALCGVFSYSANSTQLCNEAGQVGITVVPHSLYTSYYNESEKVWQTISMDDLQKLVDTRKKERNLVLPHEPQD